MGKGAGFGMPTGRSESERTLPRRVPADHEQLGAAPAAVLREMLHADETTLQVLREPGKKAQSKSYSKANHNGLETHIHFSLLEHYLDFPTVGVMDKDFLIQKA